MANIFYLLNFTVSGIKNIDKDVRLNFYKKTIDKNFDPEKYRIKGIYGENGAGKSALITAVKIFQDLVLRDQYLGESKTQIILDGIINKATREFRFQCEFLVKGSSVERIYQYSVHIGKGKNDLYEIQYELLQLKPGTYTNSNYKMIFESRNGTLTYINCPDHEKDILDKKTANLLSSHSFIYLYIMNLDENAFLEKDVISKELLIHMLFLITFLMKVTVYLGDEDQHELYSLQKSLRENAFDHQPIIGEFLDHKDNLNSFYSVNEKYISKQQFEAFQETVQRLTSFIKIFKPNLVSIDIDAKNNGDIYVCELNLNYGDYIINKEFESTGIKKLIRLFDCFVAASNDGIVFVDEMDSNINDVYLCRLIEYFMYYGKGQLCFTSHNLDPMTVLKENRNSIDFLSSDHHLVSWTSRGNASPEKCYKNGMIEDSPFNIEPADFVGILVH